MDDYQQGRDGQPRDAYTDNNEYLKGQADRAAWERHTAEMESSIRGGGGSSGFDPSPATSAQPMDGGYPSYPSPGGGTYLPRPESDTDDLLGFYIGIPLTGALIAAVVALLVGGSPLQWGAIVGGGMFAIFVGLVLVVGGVVTLLWAARYVLSLWIWALGLGALGATLGFGLGTIADQPSALVQQNAIGLSVLGIGAGLALGTAHRVVRALHR